MLTYWQCYLICCRLSLCPGPDLDRPALQIELELESHTIVGVTCVRVKRSFMWYGLGLSLKCAAHCWSGFLAAIRRRKSVRHANCPLIYVALISRYKR